MADTLELSARTAEILNAQEVPAVAIDKLRDIKAVEVADCVTQFLTRRLERITSGLAAHVQDLGFSPQLLKLADLIPEVALRTKMCVRRIWSECKAALEPPKPVGIGGS